MPTRPAASGQPGPGGAGGRAGPGAVAAAAPEVGHAVQASVPVATAAQAAVLRPVQADQGNADAVTR